MTEELFVVIRKEDWVNKSGELMLSSASSQKIFERIDSAIKYVLLEAAHLESYAISIGVKSKDIEVARMLDKDYDPCRFLNVVFPEDRGHNENRSVTWKIETTELIKD